MIRFTCPGCKKPLQVADQQAGVLLCCPHCKAQMRAPTAAPAPAAAPAPRPAPVPPQPPTVAYTPPAAMPPRTNPAPAAPPAPPEPDLAAPPWKRTLHRAGHKSAEAGRWLLREGRASAVATWNQTVCLARFGKNWWQARALRRKEKQQELALGQRLVESGAGNPPLRQQIAAVDQQITQAEASKQSTKALKAQRTQLLHQLAASTLALPVLPRGAENEVKTVQDTRAAIGKQDEELKAARATLKPRDRATWLRVGVGYAACGLAVVVAASIVLPDREEKRNTKQIAKLDTSMNFVPEDAAFYRVWMHNRDQVDAIARSNAWKKLTESPSYQLAWSRFMTTPGGTWQQYQDFKNDAENKPLLDLADDAWGQEIFLYGGSNCVASGQIYKEMYRRGLVGALSSTTQVVSGTQKPLVDFLKKLSANPDGLRVPDVVLGFRLKKPDGAAAALKRVEALFKKNWKGQSEFRKVAGYEFLVLTLDLSGIVWESFPLFASADQGELDGLMKKLRQLKPVISLGRRDDYLLIALGESPAILEKIGQGKPLVERPEFQPLGPFAKERLTEVTYLSHAFRGETAYGKKDVAQWGVSAKSFVNEYLSFVNSSIRKRLDTEIDTIATDLQATVPEPSASFAFSFLTGRGLEGYEYDWTPNPGADGSQPLTLLNHVGGDPLFASVSRSKYQPENYQRLAKWLKGGYSVFEDTILPNLPQNTQEELKRTAKVMQPLWPRVDKTTSDLLLPALRDGQTAWVIDAKLTGDQWIPNMAKPDKPLPMLEPALVLSVSDAGLLRKAGAEYMAIARQFTKSMGEIQEGVPEVPPVESEKVNGGEVFFWRLPAFPGMDKRLQPNLGLSDKVMTMALSREHSSRLLTPTPFREGLLKTDKPLAAATYFNWAATVDATTAWIDYAIQHPPLRVPPQPDETARQIKQVHDITDILKALRSYSSVTYLEQKGGRPVTVTHAEIVVQDAP